MKKIDREAMGKLAGALILGVGLAYQAAIGMTRNRIYRMGVASTLAAAFLFIWADAAVGIIGDEHDAAIGCTLIQSYPDGKILKEEGDCQQRRPPASTFKVPLALMGFDSGLLKDAHIPSLAYKDEYASDMDIQKKTTDPQIWLKDSIVWYSQWLTRQMGAEKFDGYVRLFRYGNQDVSGTPGKNNGLTESWLFTSLAISPREQADFIEKLLNHDLGVSQSAYTKVIEIMPEFAAGGWKVFGKTGSGWTRDENGVYDRTKPQGWFVGWAEQDNQKIIFAKLVRGQEKWDDYGGPKARDAFLEELKSF